MDRATPFAGDEAERLANEHHTWNRDHSVPAPFGGCQCSQGRIKCNCGLEADHEFPTFNAQTCAIAAALVALAAIASAFFPMGFSQ